MSRQTQLDNLTGPLSAFLPVYMTLKVIYTGVSWFRYMLHNKVMVAMVCLLFSLHCQKLMQHFSNTVLISVR